MTDNPLKLDRLNAVVVGNGAIGAALAQALLQQPQLSKVFVLHRGATPTATDHRVKYLAFDAMQPETIATAAETVAANCERVHLLINTVGMLHAPGQKPEKRLADLDPDKLLRSMALNAALLPQLAQAFSRLLRHADPAMLASLSARVGSMTDNKLGGWYSYRASKAAHNMLLLTLATEWRVSHPNVIVLALHPGTVQSRLSEPFLSPNYPNRVLTPAECAAALLQVMTSSNKANSGSFLDWQGESIPW